MERSSGGDDDKDKKQMLYQRDEQMTKFLDEFPGQMETERNALELARRNVVILLEHISQGIERQGAMPGVDEHEAQKGTLAFKSQQLESSKATQQRLEAELEKRQAELVKIKT